MPDPINLAARDLPEGWSIELHVERGSGTVYLFDPEYERQAVDCHDEATWQEQIKYAVKWAKAEAAKVKP